MEEEKKQEDLEESKDTKESNKVDEEVQKEEKIEVVSKAEYDKLKYQLANVINELKDTEKEFDNYRKRTREEIKQAKTDGMTKAIETLIPAIDSFKKARKIVSDKSCLSGISLIEKSMFAELEKLGVKKIQTKNKMFDHDLHNAIMTVEKEDLEPGTIVDEVEAGYTLNDKVIKYSQVVVSK